MNVIAAMRLENYVNNMPQRYSNPNMMGMLNTAHLENERLRMENWSMRSWINGCQEYMKRQAANASSANSNNAVNLESEAIQVVKVETEE